MRKFKILIILLSSILLACSVSTSNSSDDSSFDEEEARIKYTINFYSYDNSLLTTQIITCGDRVARPENPERDEYRFVGWYETQNFSKRFNFSKPIESNKNLYARFISNSYIPTGEEFTPEAAIQGSNIFIEDENGVRNITIPSLYVCDHEVTQAEWSEYMTWYGEFGHKIDKKLVMPTLALGLGDNYPTYWVCWYECIIYCNLRSEAEGLVPAYYITIEGDDFTDPLDWMQMDNSYIEMNSEGKFYYNNSGDSAILNQIRCNIDANGYRIPTEAEWEYIARGGAANDSTYSPIGDYAWYSGNANRSSHEVKIKEPNTLGIYDILGNVSEICYDRYGIITSQTDIYGAEGFLCIRRGGGYSNSEYGTDKANDINYPTGCNISARGQPKAPSARSQYGGLRVICTIN